MAPTRKFWLRLYAELAENRKVQTLEPVLFKAYINLLCLAARHDGAVPCLEDVTWTLRCSEADASAWIETLVEKGLIDGGDGPLRMHDWDDYQVADGTERSRKSRAAKGNGIDPKPPSNNGKSDATRMQRASPLQATGTQQTASVALERKKREREELDSLLTELESNSDRSAADSRIFVIGDENSGSATGGAKRVAARGAVVPIRPKATPPPAVPLVFVEEGTPAWIAWTQRQGRAPPVTDEYRGLRRGWYFVTEFPEREARA